ncbi:hypothetical protein FGG08_004310 [Glutinoglossum americanum]|uniref:Regulator of phospholipase D SRF1 n=1 Tax=Glutinoglossum americanum TaxID=1670608 RepID=A0A9P8I7U2_9PEZI|nr:hypothetical protein FGG08_004310 [Glutinoglossum americanum]
MVLTEKALEDPGGMLLPSSSADRPVSGSSGMSSLPPSIEHRPKPQLASSGNAAAEDRAAQREVRTLPTWVHSFEEGDAEDTDPTKRLLPTYPGNIQHAHHNNSPAPQSVRPGKLHDAARDRTPVAISAPVHEYTSRWHVFAKGSVYPPASSGESQLVDDAWLEANGGDLESPWGAGNASGDGEKGDELIFLRSKTKRRVWYVRAQRTLLRNPIIPLVFRLIIWLFSLIALALGGSIFHISETEGFSQRPSTLMAIIVDIIALVYILYITYDEYTGKPLGLRSPKAKMRLILLDLFFIVFDSANLSLAFDALSDVRWSCKDDSGTGSATPRNALLCVRQRALSSVLLVALVAWITTFSISVLRSKGFGSSKCPQWHEWHVGDFGSTWHGTGA